VGQKLMIVLLVVVAVVFAVTLAMGGSHKARSAGDSDPAGIGFLDGLQGKRFLRLGDKATTTCITGDQVTLNVPVGLDGCTIAVEKRSFFSRPTRVAFVAHGSVSVTVDSKRVPGKATSVDSDKCFGSAIDHGGGTIIVTAPAATTITLQQTACPRDAGS
jgi:hypothetical protein